MTAWKDKKKQPKNKKQNKAWDRKNILELRVGHRSEPKLSKKTNQN